MGGEEWSGTIANVQAADRRNVSGKLRFRRRETHPGGSIPAAGGSFVYRRHGHLVHSLWAVVLHGIILGIERLVDWRVNGCIVGGRLAGERGTIGLGMTVAHLSVIVVQPSLGDGLVRGIVEGRGVGGVDLRVGCLWRRGRVRMVIQRRLMGIICCSTTRGVRTGLVYEQHNR